MNLEPVEVFEEKFGRERTYGKVRDFMFCYLDKVTKPLPEVARRSVEAAKANRMGTPDDKLLERTRVECWKYLCESSGGELDEPSKSAIRAVICILFGQPQVGVDNVDLLDFFVRAIDEFEDHRSEANDMLQRIFR